MKVMRTMNGEIQYQEIQPEFLKQFKRRGWLEAPDVKIPEKKIPIAPPTVPDYDNMKHKELVAFAVANGMPKGKASQSKKEDLLTFLK